MSERNDLLGSIASHIQTYRQGEIREPDSDHVDRWVSQFTPDAQVPFLREFNYVINKSFIKKENVEHFLNALVKNNRLVGADPASFWARTNFLEIQKDGQSQTEMTKIFRMSLWQQLQIDLTKCGNATGDFVYLDDILFSGNRVASDLENWITHQAPNEATVHIILIALYSSGYYYLQSNRLKKVIDSSGKKIKTVFWRALELENKLSYSYSSDVFWPTNSATDPVAAAYAVAQQYPPKDRRAGGSSKMFLSDEGRQLLEREFLLAGLKIRSKAQDPKSILRPLGFGSFGFGFGSTLVTYRNCPNNCPLAMWWGDPTATSGPLNWYPLLPRKGYQSAENIFKI